MPHKTLKVGSRRQVYNGSAEKTSGGLKKEDLIKNKHGRIVSSHPDCWNPHWYPK